MPVPSQAARSYSIRTSSVQFWLVYRLSMTANVYGTAAQCAGSWERKVAEQQGRCALSSHRCKCHGSSFRPHVGLLLVGRKPPQFELGVGGWRKHICPHPNTSVSRGWAADGVGHGRHVGVRNGHLHRPHPPWIPKFRQVNSKKIPGVS